MQYNQYLETGLLSPYYVLPLFRRDPDSGYIERYKDRYQAVPVHMDQEDIAKYLASMSGEVECTERLKVGKKKVRAVKKAEKKAKKKELKEAKKEREAARKEEKAKLKALKKAAKKVEKAKKKEVKEMKKKIKRRWRRTSKVTPMVIGDEATLL